MPGTLQDELKRLRKEQNLRQEDVARVLGMPKSTYALKEKLGDFTQQEIKELNAILNTNLQLADTIPIEKETKGIVRNKDEYVVAALIRQESMLRVLLWSIAEMLAAQRGQPVATVVRQLEDAVKDESILTLEGLQ